MISAQHQSEFENLFPFIRRSDADFVTEFYTACSHIELPAGASICDEGEHCAQLSMLLDGVGRIYKLSAGGREVTLYRVIAGEACVLTASCIKPGRLVSIRGKAPTFR